MERGLSIAVARFLSSEGDFHEVISADGERGLAVKFGIVSIG